MSASSLARRGDAEPVNILCEGVLVFAQSLD